MRDLPASACWTWAAAAASWPTRWRARGANVLGIDLAAKPLKVAQLHALEAGTEAVEYREVPPRHWPPRSRAASTWSPAWRCSSTCPTRRPSSRPVRTLVKPGGWVFFSTINRNAKSFLFAIVGAEYVLRLLPKGTHEYASFIRPSELAQWCRACRPRAAATRAAWNTTR